MIRTSEHAKLDEEERILEEIEEQLIADVAFLWKRTREMAGHEAWTEWWCGCDCNSWNRHELKQAIRRLKAWRQGIYQSY